jgi:hypothetical protein
MKLEGTETRTSSFMRTLVPDLLHLRNKTRNGMYKDLQRPRSSSLKNEMPHNTTGRVEVGGGD